ncbi:MAG: DNA replication/repair protein RecF [Lentisphaeria bacterium]
MLAQVRLLNFRNYDSCQVRFAPGMNFLLGDNGQGKTNILEAVYYLALLRSFRTNMINDLCQWPQDSFVLHGLLESPPNPPETLAVSYGSERRLLINNTPVYRASDFINRFLCVTFIPQDLELICGPPARRRRFLDIAISQLDAGYLRHLQAFYEALKSRNAMLKQPDKYPPATIRAYDQVLVKHTAAIELARRRFAASMDDILVDKSRQLFGEQHLITLKYLSRLGFYLESCEGDEEELSKAYSQGLQHSFERDLKNGSTSCGPHRAELSCLLDQKQLQKFGSQGEMRMASLAMRFALLDLIRSQRNPDDVVILVDDVIGELDEQRRANFIAELNKSGQILFACTRIPREFTAAAKVLKIRGGKIED